MADLTGTSASDTLTGTLAADTIRGLAGNDFLFGDDGDDTLFGGEGNDRIDGEDGIDTVSYADAAAAIVVRLALAAEQDTIGAGRDTVAGIENVVGSAFNDRIGGSAGFNILDGGAGIDTVTYVDSTVGVVASLMGAAGLVGATEDTLLNFENFTGSAFDDLVAGTAGNNSLGGGSGNDTLSYAGIRGAVVVNLATTTQQDTLAGGRDTIFGFENLIGTDFNDTLFGNSGANRLDGGAGVDTVSYQQAAAGVMVDLSRLDAQDTGGDGVDTLANFENVTGSVFDDVFVGTAGKNVFNGRLGNDTVSYAGAALTTDAKGIAVNLLLGSGQVTGIAGIDTLTGIEAIIGTLSADSFIGDAESNRFDGGLGIDLVSYAGNASGVVVDLGVTVAQDTRGAGLDTLVGFENLTGTGFDDVLAGNSGDNILIGGGGRDILSYAAASAGVKVSLASTVVQDTIGAGRDKLSGFEGLLGSAFADTLTGNAADNLIEGGAGDDVLAGGLGVDTASYAGAGAAVNVRLAVSVSQATGGAGFDRLTGFENLVGSAFADRLEGNGLVNILEGGLGDDTLIGQADDFVSYAGASGAVGVDFGRTGPAASGAAGNDTIVGISNVIGSAFGDTMIGTPGDDIFEGGAGDDFLIGASGVNTASFAGAANGVTADLRIQTTQDTGVGLDLMTNFANLFGSRFNDLLIGDDGTNTLRGGLGNDDLRGGLGTDTASYSDATAKVTVDLVLAGPQNTFGGGIDTLSGFENLTGSNFQDTLRGDDAANIIDGGLGADRLVGRGGSDTFVMRSLTTTSNRDYLVDFVAADDLIALSAGAFRGLALGALDAAAFFEGAAATSAAHRVIFNADTGAVSWDADGLGGRAAVAFAQLNAGTDLTAANIVIIG